MVALRSQNEISQPSWNEEGEKLEAADIMILTRRFIALQFAQLRETLGRRLPRVDIAAREFDSKRDGQEKWEERRGERGDYEPHRESRLTDLNRA